VVYDLGRWRNTDPFCFHEEGAQSSITRVQYPPLKYKIGGGGGGALLVESPAEAGGCSPGNARAAARVAEPDVTTMRANSMVATTAAFLIMDSEELLLLLFPELYVLDFSFGSDSIAATKSHDLDSSRLL